MLNVFLNFIKKAIRKVLLGFIKWIELHKYSDDLLKKSISNYHNTVSYNEAVFYYESRVINLQRDSSKIRIGDGTHIRGELLTLKYGGEIEIGSNCYVGDHVRIWSGESVKVGNNVLISHNVNIIDTNSHEIDAMERAEGYVSLINTGFPDKKGTILTAPIVIKDFVWISFNAIILKGVTIGEGAIIASGSVVTKDVREYTVVAGNPAIEVKDLKKKDDPKNI